MSFLLIGDTIVKDVVDIFRTVMYILSEAVCELIIYASDIFMRLGRAEILTNSQVQTIYSRVTLLLGLFMLFKMSFSFVQYLINPETMSDKSKGAGKLVMKAVVVIVLLGTTPYIFSTAFKFQNLVLDSNVIGRVITATNAEGDVSQFGSDLASYLFLSFYSPTLGVDLEDRCPELGSNDMENLRDEIKYNHSFSLGLGCLDKSLEERTLFDPTSWVHGLSDGYVIDFTWHGLGLLAVSVFIAYILITYCLSVGMRVVQLAFLQLIAPIPIISYLGQDKDEAFPKWVKRCLSTFLDLFIRMLIIYFVVYLIRLLLSNDSESYLYFLYTAGNPGFRTRIILTVILIMGLLLFAKKAPELLKEVLPGGLGGQDYGISLGKRWKDIKETAAPVGKAVGFAAGGVVGGGVSAVARFNSNRRAGRGLGKSLLGAAGGYVSGTVGGLRAGGKDGKVFTNLGTAIKNRNAADNRYNDLIVGGGSTFGAIRSKIVDIGGETHGQRNTRRIRDLQQLEQHKKEMTDAINEVDAVKVAKQAYESMVNDGSMTPEEFEMKKNEAYAKYRAIRNAVQEASIKAAKTGDYSAVEFKDDLKIKYKGYDDNGNLVDKEVVPFNLEFNQDNTAYANQAYSALQRANDEIRSRHIQHFDGENWTYIGELETASDLRDVETKSRQSSAHVYGDNYGRSLAEDAYFGVDSNKSKNKHGS